MSVYPEGCKVLVRDPVNSIDRRPARVVRQAVQGIDDFVCVKYPGQPKEFCVNWSDITPINNFKSLLAKPAPSKKTTVTEAIVISDDEEPFNPPLLEANPPQVQAASAPRKPPILIERRTIRQKQNNVTGTFRLSRDESRTIPDSDRGDENQRQVKYYFGDDGDLFYENRSDDGHISNDDQNRAVHPANLRRRHPAPEGYLHGSSRRSDARHVQDFNRTGMARNRSYNDASEEAVKQLDVDEYRYGHPSHLHSNYLEGRDREPASQMPGVIHPNDHGRSSGLPGDHPVSAHSDAPSRFERPSLGSRRPLYFRNEPARLSSDKKLPARHPDLTVLSIPVPRAKRQISDGHDTFDSTGGETTLQAAREKRPPQSPTPISPRVSFAHSDPCHQQTAVKRVRVQNNHEDSNHDDARSSSMIAQNLRRPVHLNNPPPSDATEDLSSPKKSARNESYSRPPLDTLPDIAPSFTASNPFTSTNETEDDKAMSELLNDIVMDFETSISRDEPDIYGGNSRPERAPPCRRKKSTPVKRRLNGIIEEAILLFRGRNEKHPEVFIADMDTALSNDSGQVLRVHSCLCGYAEEPNIIGRRGSIQCGMCGLWSHLRCTQLLEDEIDQYKTRERRFMCWSCVENVMIYGQHLRGDENPKWGIQTRPVLPISSIQVTDLVSNQLSRRKRQSIRKSLTEDERKARADNIEALREGLPRWSVGTRERNVVDKAVARESVASLLP